jgi:menaquinone-9 beta-reductase
VGASVAGCAAATLLGRAGASVALIDSHSDPRAYKRMCTHFIQASAIPVLARLGVAEEIERAGGQPSGLNLWTRYGWISYALEWASPPVSDHPALNIRRETLDPMLRSLAADSDGVELMLGQTVTALLRDASRDGRVAGVLARGRDGDQRELRAKLVIGADGADSQVAALAGLAAKQTGNNRFGYFALYRDTPLVTGSNAQMWLLDPDVAYAFATDGGLTLLMCMPHKRRLGEFKRDPEQAMAAVFAGLPDGPQFDPAKRESKLMGKLEMPNIVRPLAAPGLALIGDAGVASDPMWGVGCGFALQSAEWLSDAVAPTLRAGEQALDRGVERYARRHRKAILPHEKLCAAYSTGRRFNPAEKLFYRGAARNRELARRMVEMGSRWVTPRQMLTPSTLALLIRANLDRSARPNGLRTPPPAPLVAVKSAA